MSTIPAPEICSELLSPPPREVPPRSEMEIARLSNRIWSVVVGLTMAGINVVPGLLIFDYINSVMLQAAIVATSGKPWMIAVATTIGLVFATPHIFMMAFSPTCKWRIGIQKLAAVGYAFAALGWASMALLSRGLDYGFFGWILTFDGIMNLVVFFAIALSRNHEILRELFENNRGRI